LKKYFITLISIVIILGLFTKQIEYFFLTTTSIDWALNFIIFKIGFAVVLLLIVILAWLGLKQILLKLALSALCIIGLGLYFFLNPVYATDFSTHSEKIELIPDSNTVALTLKREAPNFNGLFITVRPDCEHCHEIGSTVNLLHKRNPDLSITFLVFTKDTAEVNFYKKKANSYAYQHFLAEKENDVFFLNRGGFPCYFEVKNGIILRRWQTEDFGYRVLDELESLF
jgi:hypothetical protein